MEAEQASLSTIIIDSNGNPIGQVIYRCALCRKTCDSSSDAMIHYQVDHIQPQQQLQQRNLATSTNHQTLNHHQNARSSSQNQRIHYSSGNSTARHQQFATSSATSTANSILKRATSGSLLKRASHGSLPSTSAGQNSLLKRGPNVMRCYDSGTTGPTAKNNIRRQLNSANKLETIHRQYTTTSASRAAKRHMNPPKGSSTTNTTNSACNNSTSVNANSVSTNKSIGSINAIEKGNAKEKTKQQTNNELSNKSTKNEQPSNTLENVIKTSMGGTDSSRTPTSATDRSASSNSQTPSQTRLTTVNSKHQLLSKTLTPELQPVKTNVSIDSIAATLSTSATTTPRRLALTPKSYYNLRRRFNKNFKNKN